MHALLGEIPGDTATSFSKKQKEKQIHPCGKPDAIEAKQEPEGRSECGSTGRFCSGGADSGPSICLTEGHEPLPLVKTVKHKLDPCRDSQLFVDTLQVVPNDSGSTALGLSIAFLALDFWRSNSVTPSRIIFPLLVAALPLLDATFAVIRRLVAGGVPWRGDRCHLYDLLRAAGWVPRRVALTIYTVTAALAAIALWGLRQESVGFWLAAVLSVCVLVVLGVRLGVLRQRGETSAPQNMSRVMKKETAGSS